jgi:hypothetical protein
MDGDISISEILQLIENGNVLVLYNTNNCIVYHRCIENKIVDEILRYNDVYYVNVDGFDLEYINSCITQLYTNHCDCDIRNAVINVENIHNYYHVTMLNFSPYYNFIAVSNRYFIVQFFYVKSKCKIFCIKEFFYAK